jgi:hypothetical protein
MDVTFGIYNCKDENAKQAIDIWMLQNYKSKVWRHTYRVRLPVGEIKGLSACLNPEWHVNVLAVTHELADYFHHDGQYVYACKHMLKQTLVSHTFFAAENYDVNASPFV